MSQFSRRTFMLGIGASMVPGLLRSAKAGPPPRVVVVGAGLAGLAAAYELGQAGFDVRVAEQSRRLGGRVKTIRGHFDDGAWIDVGGQGSGAGYANFFYYAQKFDLQLEAAPSFEQRPDVLLHLRGSLLSGSVLRDRPDSWPIALTDAERAFAPSRLLNYYLRPIAAEIGQVDRVLSARYAHYDDMSLLELLREKGASDAAIALIEQSLNYNSLSTVSALGALRDAVRTLHVAGGQALNIVNGNSSLPEAFGTELGDRIQRQCRLKALRYDGDGVRLHFETQIGREVWDADFVVIALPFTALRDVLIEPGLPADRKRIIDDLPYTQIAQTYLQTSRRFWEDGSPIAAIYTDGPLERLFNASSRMSGGRGLLINWMNGTGAMRINALDAEQQARYAIEQIEKVWPESRALIEKTYSNNWGNSYARGAYAHYAPGQLTRYATDIPKPIGPLHFAGEHTELVAPGMEGALTSGRRAAEEILARTVA